TRIAKRKEGLPAAIDEPAGTETLRGFHLNPLTFPVLAPHRVLWCVMLTGKFRFDHGLLFGQGLDHLVTRSTDGIVAGAHWLSRGQGQVLEDAHAVLRVGLN